MLDHKLVLISKEFAARIGAALGELPFKFAQPVLADLDRQLNMADKDPTAYIKAIEAHLATVKASLPAVPPKE